ncbi:MAG: DegT/DnrJ/EryC1/StrS aminotransferase family protein [Campylobacteraceae bacterium]|jgi:dTDP-4-amino-4,6-dideoxygalactose transaminase|nr:DegT/DnrJ/EryC1/StrS aminotransferase family protein [Campylobacteraceae bacterium]
MREIPFFKPSIDKAEIELVNSVLDNNDKSDKAEKLEATVKKYTGAKYATATYNGTSSMHLAMCALDLKRGDKFICSVNSAPAAAEVVRHFDAEPIFVDINADDFNISIDKLSNTLVKQAHKKLKGVFISHIAGQPSDLDPIYELAKKYNIKIVDDAMSAFGAVYKEKKLGSFSLDSEISCFRFSPQSKHSIAGGGVMTTSSEELNDRAKLLRNHAMVSEGWDKFGNLGYLYNVVDIGVKYDINELNAAYVLGQLSKIDKFIARQKEIASIYDKELANCPHIQTPIKKRDHIYNQYIIKVDKNRDSFAKALKEVGIFTGLHYIPLHLLSYYKTKYALKVNDFPTALANYQQILSIPIYAAMSDNDVLYVCEQINNIAKHRV